MLATEKIQTHKANKQWIAPFEPLPWQYAPWKDKSHIMLLTGSAGGGKSRLAAEKVHAFMLKYPGAMGLMLRKARETMTNSTVLFYERLIVGGDPRCIHKQTKNRFEYSNGSILAYGGMYDEKQRQKVRSIGIEGGLDIIWFEEAIAFEEKDFFEGFARLRGTKAGWNQAILSTNPGGPNHYIHRQLMMQNKATIYKSSVMDNPHLSPAYKVYLDMLTGVLRDRLVNGLWVQEEGVVYAEFEPYIDGNLTEQEPDRTKPIELAYDDGFIDPRVILFIQKTATEILVFDEIYHKRKLEEDTIQEIKDRLEERQLPLPEIAVGSSEAPALKKRFRLADIPARSIPHMVVDGIKAVRPLIVDGQGRRVLKVHKRCVNWLGEITSDYRYPEEGKKRDNEKPLDGDDHGCEAFSNWVWVRARHFMPKPPKDEEK